VFLNNLVIILVYFPTYAKVAHFRVTSDILFFGFLLLRDNFFYVHPLLCNIVFIICVSLCLCSVDMG
jgi:hypothetical protein